MKKALKIIKQAAMIIGEMIMWGSLSFTGALCIYLGAEFIGICRYPVSETDIFWGNDTHWKAFMADKVSAGLIVQLFGLCMCISALQYVFFSGKVLKKSPYMVRMGSFGVLCFGVCVLFAYKSKWFWMDNIGHWAKFVGIFLTAFVGISLLFEVYFRVMGKRYNEALGRHQKRLAAKNKGPVE